MDLLMLDEHRTTVDTPDIYPETKRVTTDYGLVTDKFCRRVLPPPRDEILSSVWRSGANPQPLTKGARSRSN
jgi:hypothetical protein